jgi:hypothetical protein
MKLTLLLSVLFGIIFPFKAIAEEWIEVKTKSGINISVDLDSIKSNGDIVWYWQRVFDYPDLDQRYFLSANCKTRVVRQRELIIFDSISGYSHTNFGDEGSLFSIPEYGVKLRKLSPEANCLKASHTGNFSITWL